MTITDEQITAAARALSNDNADVCNVNREDNWNLYGDSFRETARVALEAALSTHSAPAVDANAAWDAYLDEQKRILGMPGLMARPSFIAGYRAALSTKSEAAAGEPVAWMTKSDGYVFYSYNKPDRIEEELVPLYTAPPAASDADFKNFHRLLCERFDYVHDEKDWKRDQLSLIERIANWRDQFEFIDTQNHTYRKAMQKIMARLTELLDEDRFAEIEALVKSVGVEPPAASGQKLTDEQINAITDTYAKRWSSSGGWNVRRCVQNALIDARALLRAASATASDSQGGAA